VSFLAAAQEQLLPKIRRAIICFEMIKSPPPAAA